jgi:site-specific DNA-methyltransferase (adenine-specific)
MPDYDDRLSAAEYLDLLRSLLVGCRHVLSSTGTIWLQIGQTYQAEALLLLKELGYHHRQTIIWHYTFGPNQPTRFTPSYQLLHYATIDRQQLTFNADAVRVPSWRQLNGDKRANPRDRLPDDVWTIPRLPGNARERVKDADGKNHPCQTPEKLLRRVVLACSNPGELVLDPVCGTGSTLAVAVKHGRRAIGIELSERTAALARMRLAAQENALQATGACPSSADNSGAIQACPTSSAAS